MGAEKQVTIMVLKVDLQCSKCYKKVKKILCKIPQIQDQEYDEKNGTVTIKVVCCSPQKIKEKIICKGGDSIKSIEIKVPEKPKPKPADKPKESEKPKEAEKPKQPPPAAEKQIAPPPQPESVTAVPGFPPPAAVIPIGVCCPHPGMPCFHGYGGPPPCYQYDGYSGRPVYDSYGGGRNYCVNHCDTYFCEENPQRCTIM